MLFKAEERNSFSDFEVFARKVNFVLHKTKNINLTSKLFHLAFLVLRNNGCLLVSLLAMTLSSGMPELQSEADLEYMREMLQLNDNITEEAALTHFRSHTRISNVIMFNVTKTCRKDFNTSLQQSYTVTANWWIHIMSQLGNKSN